MFPIRKSSSDLLIPNTQVRIMAVFGGLDEQEMQIASKRVVLFLKENLEPLNNSKNVIQVTVYRASLHAWVWCRFHIGA